MMLNESYTDVSAANSVVVARSQVQQCCQFKQLWHVRCSKRHEWRHEYSYGSDGMEVPTRTSLPRGRLGLLASLDSIGGDCAS